jgi:organic radical activating enzyme
MIKLSKNIGNNFCFAPWTNLHLTIDGDYKTCCIGSTLLGNIQTNSIDEAVNSEKLKLIQLNLIANKENTNCEACVKNEVASGVSERQWYDQDPIEINSLSDRLNYSFDIRWNNVCDLSCTYCSGAFSSTWATLTKTKVDMFYNKPNIKTVYDYISAHKNEIKQINLVGGEPMLMKENIRLFDVIDGTNIKLYIISNLASDLKTNQIFQKLMSISNNFQIDVSFETLDSKFEYVRHGGKWSTMLNNLRYVQNFIKTNKTNSNIGITSLYSVYNALDISKFESYLSDNNLPSNRLSWLKNPSALNVLNLPTYFKDRCIAELVKLVENNSNNKTFALQMINSIQNYQSQNINCDYLNDWHAKQESTHWPTFPLKFNELWSEFSINNRKSEKL